MSVQLVPDTATRAATTTISDVDEVALVEGMRRGDRDAAEFFARWLYPRMYAAAYKILGDDQNARDAVQDSFVRVMTAIHRFRAEAKFSTWVLRVVVNSALMIRRQTARTDARVLDDLHPRFADDGHRLNVGEPWEELDTSEMTRLVRNCLDELPDDARTVLVLRDMVGIETAECATMLGIRGGAVKTRLHRARMALRELVEARRRSSSTLSHTDLNAQARIPRSRSVQNQGQQ